MSTADGGVEVDDGVRVLVHDDHVALVELARPPANVLEVGLVRRLAAALEELDRDPRVRAVVLAAEGRHFCAGADLASGPGATSADVEAGGRALYDAGLRLFATAKPVVAAVQGAAVGGGLGLALAADFRVVSPSSRLTANFAALGFHHGFGLTVTLPRLVGEQQALRLLLTAQRIDGEHAVQLGLAEECVPEDELRPRAHALAARIAACAPLAVQSIRATFRQPLLARLRTATEHELAEQVLLRATADFAEGVAAVTDRRPAVFTGT